MWLHNFEVLKRFCCSYHKSCIPVVIAEVSWIYFIPLNPYQKLIPVSETYRRGYFYNYLMIQTCPAENSKPKYWTYGKNIITIRFWTLSSSVELAICGRNFDFQTWHGTIITPNEIILWKAVTISILVEVWTLYGQPLWVGAFWTGILYGRR